MYPLLDSYIVPMSALPPDCQKICLADSLCPRACLDYISYHSVINFLLDLYIENAMKCQPAAVYLAAGFSAAGFSVSDACAPGGYGILNSTYTIKSSLDSAAVSFL